MHLITIYVQGGHLMEKAKTPEKLTSKGTEKPKRRKSDANARLAHELLSRTVANHADDILELYAANEENTRVETVEVSSERPSAKILYLSELLIGNQDSAVEFLLDTIEQVKSLPDDEKPDAVVVSGLIQGDFKFYGRTRRVTLVPGLEDMDPQFRHARQILDKIAEIGVPVIYNMGNDDQRIALESNIEVFRKLNKLQKKHVKDQALSLSIGTRADVVKPEDRMGSLSVEQLKFDPRWNEHLAFQIEKVFPYCLRAGRRLYTADEMTEKSKGTIKVEEYLMLDDVERRRKNGEPLTRAQERWLKKVNKKQNQDVIITDNVNLHIQTAGHEYTDWIRHNLGFSDSPMYQSHMKVATDALGQRAANGQETPDMLVTQHAQEDIGVSVDNHWVVSTGGLIEPSRHLQTRGSKSDTAGDTSKRLVRTRRRTPSPSATSHERTDDGRYIVTLFNKKLCEKSESIPERMTIAELCDFQTGSITARPDLLAKYLDYIRVHAMGERATALFFGGDMIHGRNYADFASESQQTGLMSVDSQKNFNTSLFREAFANATSEELAALVKVLVQPGNHEWNSGTQKWHGDPFVDYMCSFFEKMLVREGYSDEQIDQIVKTHKAIVTAKGEYASSFTGVEYFGEMGVLVKHFMIERGGKGSGDIPIYQGNTFASNDLTKNIDVAMSGHWHHPQYGLFGDKLFLIGGATAGLSGYELDRGYRPTIAGTLIHLGGGLPPQVEFVSEQALNNHKIQTGNFTNEQLAEEGYFTDEDFDPSSHGFYMPDGFPKSALQKRLHQIRRDISQRANDLAVLR